MSDAALRIEGVGHSYQEGDPVLRDIDLELAPGEFLTLLGPSGCGKTTLLRIVGGFIRPTEGSVFLNGEDVTRVPPHKRRVGHRPSLTPPRPGAMPPAGRAGARPGCRARRRR